MVGVIEGVIEPPSSSNCIIFGHIVVIGYRTSWLIDPI